MCIRDRYHTLENEQIQNQRQRNGCHSDKNRQRRRKSLLHRVNLVDPVEFRIGQIEYNLSLIHI